MAKRQPIAKGAAATVATAGKNKSTGNSSTATTNGDKVKGKATTVKKTVAAIDDATGITTEASNAASSVVTNGGKKTNRATTAKKAAATFVAADSTSTTTATTANGDTEIATTDGGKRSGKVTKTVAIADVEVASNATDASADDVTNNATTDGGKRKGKVATVKKIAAASTSKAGPAVSNGAATKKDVTAAVTTSKTSAVAAKASITAASDDVATTSKVKPRGRPAPASNLQEPPEKKLKLWKGYEAGGVVLTVGQGDTGQLGLGEDVMEKSRPAVVSQIPDKCQQVCAGGMHTVCLTVQGQVYTFGCNDEGALGRTTAEEEDTMVPGLVDMGNEKVVCVSAGDSHSACLTQSQRVYIWGIFRDSSGAAGMLDGTTKLEKPTLLDSAPEGVIKICSGNDHLVLLTTSGDIYTLGSSEQGQLGRVSEYFVSRGGRRGLALLLTPAKVQFQKRNAKFSDVWAGQYVTFAKESTTSEIYAWGLNNYQQLGLDDTKTYFVPQKVTNFEATKDWKYFSGGQHHTLALDKDGKVYALGRKEYGRLGLGSIEDVEESDEPQLVTSLSNVQCTQVACGTSCSFAIDNDGTIYSWGMGHETLGQGPADDDVLTPKQVASQQLQNKRGIMVSVGGQHAVFLATDSTAATTATSG